MLWYQHLFSVPLSESFSENSNFSDWRSVQYSVAHQVLYISHCTSHTKFWCKKLYILWNIISCLLCHPFELLLCLPVAPAEDVGVAAKVGQPRLGLDGPGIEKKGSRSLCKRRNASISWKLWFDFGSNQRLTVIHLYKGKYEKRRKHHQHNSHTFFLASLILYSLWVDWTRGRSPHIAKNKILQ